MPKYKLQSTLTKIYEEVFQHTDFESAKQIMLDYLQTTEVKDKFKMIDDVSKCRNLAAVQRYCANSLLKYEGLGTSRY